MAEIEAKYKDNVAGKYFVVDECIDCDACREQAPNNFKRNEEEGYSYVYKQPTTDLELKECAEALDGCPVEAIGDFGVI